MRTFEWLARLIQTFFFDIFADVQIFLQICDSQENIYIQFFLKPHTILNLEKNIMIHKKILILLKILSSETL